MGTFGIWHWVIVLVIVVVLFGGRGKISGLMGDAAKGIRAFKEGLKDEQQEAEAEPEEAKPLPKTTASRSTTSRKKTTARS
jgi:sec-independent protein translocase protein TatA